MFNDLVTASVHTSSDMSTKLVVIQDGVAVKVPTAKASLIVKHNQDGLLVTLPRDKTERKACMRSQLPGYLAEILNIYDSRGEKQIYRIINELTTSTEQILLDEEISRVSWLPEGSRPALVRELDPENERLVSTVNGSPTNFVNGDTSQFADRDQAHEEPQHAEIIVRAAGSLPARAAGNYPPPFRNLPAIVNHGVEAPDFWKVIEHVHRQAAMLAGQLRSSTPTTLDQITASFGTLTLGGTSLDPADYPRLFGDDFWLSKFRVGAAGELFVSLVICYMTMFMFAEPIRRYMNY